MFVAVVINNYCYLIYLSLLIEIKIIIWEDSVETVMFLSRFQEKLSVPQCQPWYL